MAVRELLIDTVVHMPPARVLEQLSPDQAERRIERTNHSIAELVAHMTFWQEWLQRRCEGAAEPMAQHADVGWPAVAPNCWPALCARFLDGLDRIVAMADAVDGDTPIAPAIEFPPLAHYTVRDAVAHIAQHNSHHLGQVVMLRQLMGAWPPPSGSWTF